MAPPDPDPEPEHTPESHGTDAPQPTPGTARTERTTAEQTPNTWLNAIIGGVITAATTMFVPFSPVLGGGVAGYLEGPDTNAGIKVGVFAGFIAVLPLVLILLGALFFIPVIGGPRSALGIIVLLLFALLFLGAYVVGFSALGGILGAYLKREL